MTKPRDKPAAAKPLAVLTLAEGRIGAYGYERGLIIEQVPPDVATANAPWLEADPAKVRAARAAGADAVQYTG